MPEDFDAPDSPFIRIARNGAVTNLSNANEDTLRERIRPTRASARQITVEPEDNFLDSTMDEPEDEKPIARRTRGARPMPKRLSEEARDAAESTSSGSQEEAPAPRPRAPRVKKEPEQMTLPLKPARPKQDAVIKQRQVVGFCCIVMAVLVLLCIVSYTPYDAPFAETKLSEIPAIFTASDPAVNARADQAHNWLRLFGAMTADFLINKTIGYASIIYPIFFGWWSLAFFRFTHKQRRRLTLATTFFLITAILFSATIGTASNLTNIPREWSGAVGQYLGLAFSRLIGTVGAFIVYASAFVVTLVFSIDLDIERTFVRLQGYWGAGLTFLRAQITAFWEKREAKQLERDRIREEEEAADQEVAELEAAEQQTEVASNNSSESLQPMVEAPRKRTIKSVETKAKTGIAVNEKSEEKLPVAATVAASAAVGFERAEALEPMPLEDSVSATPAIQPVEEPVKILRSAAAGIPALAMNSQVVAGQPLLKVRPAPKTAAGGPIPRMTRPDQNKLGERSVNFSRLTNGAVPHESETPPPPERPSKFIDHAITVEPEPDRAATPAEPIQEMSNVDTSEEIIKPILSRMKPEQKISIKSTRLVEPPAPVTLGDEKALSNEALPHSVMSDEFRDVAAATITRKPTEFDGLRSQAEGDEFFEEGAKPFIPENPYQEQLTRFRNPGVEILREADPKDEVDADDEELAMKGRLLRDKLATFGVEIENITVTPGPVVTLYEFTPAEGVKVSRVENLTDDIALAMKARGIRIIAPIPGKGTIGVEIPNDVPKMVRIRSLFESESFRNTKMNLPLALGKTISGDVYIDDLNKMPHLLIAGATGSGKSVGVNGILASLLYAKSPKDVKFVIVDPKKIELSLYKKLRKHYLIVSPEAGEDIVTTPAFAVLALKAVELEMEKRYDKLAKAAVRSLADYNIKVAQGKLRSTQEEQHYHLPYIVVIIDELADLMITAGKDIEEPICRIAQMARAVGIHLILATQRPSVDVITGVIKANFPARMAFQVATRVDSRTILDSMGAEQLLGNGDMLYQPSGTPKPIRLQSPYITTEEVEAMIDAVAMQDGDKLSYSRTWTLPSLKSKDSRGGSTMEDEDTRDDLFEDAARIIVRHQQGSVSLLQRRLKVGYSRAARIVDELEQVGIVGPFDGSKARQVLCETDEELTLVLEGLR